MLQALIEGQAVANSVERYDIRALSYRKGLLTVSYTHLWSNDPTVRGMLTMLDEIQKRFADINDLWNKLDKINFYFRDIEEDVYKRQVWNS